MGSITACCPFLVFLIGIHGFVMLYPNQAVTLRLTGSILVIYILAENKESKISSNDEKVESYFPKWKSVIIPCSWVCMCGCLN